MEGGTNDDMIQKRFGLDIPVFVILQEKLEDILSKAPDWWGTSDKDIYDNLIFVMSPATAEIIAEKIGEPTKELEQICICDNTIFGLSTGINIVDLVNPEKLFFIGNRNFEVNEVFDVEINDLSKTFHVRKLDKDDVELIYNLSCKNHIFYQYHPPFVTRESILDDMEALPPGTSYDDKFYVGFFENESLVAIMDLILDYPAKEIAFIGLFMTNIQYQHKGVSSKIISEIAMYLKSLGYKKIRLGVDKGNPQSYSFWSKNNFNVISEDTYILMELDI